MPEFDDARLEDLDALQAEDSPLFHLAEAGARLRIESAQMELERLADLGDHYRPRAVITVGPEARLIRAVLEPVCPVPFVAWPTHLLPAWVGALDLVVVLTGNTYDADVSATVAEATRRGARVLVACPENSHVAEQAAGRLTTVIGTKTADATAAAIVMLVALHEAGLGPAVHPDRVAEAMDQVAAECGPAVSSSVNSAKDLALALVDDLPLVWGGSVLAARASRRIAEAIREASGNPALAADASALLPVLRGARRRDLFADPFDEPSAGRSTTLVVLDDDNGDAGVRRARGELVAEAEANDVRVVTIRHAEGDDVERYCCLLQQGLFAAAYLAIGYGA